MPSFVEDAILKVTDRSTKPIRKIDRELKKLFRTAKSGKKIPIRFDGLTKAEGDVKRLSTALRSLPRSKSVKLNFTGGSPATKQLATLARDRVVKLRLEVVGAAAARAEIDRIARVRTVKVNVAPVPVAGGGSGGGFGPRRGGRSAGNIGAPFPGNLGAGITRDLAFEAAAGLRQFTRAAVDSAFLMEQVNTKLRSVPLTSEERSMVEQRAAQGSSEAMTLPETRTKEIATDVALQLQGADQSVIDNVTELLIKAEAAASQVLPADLAKQATDTALKSLDLSGVSDDAEKAKGVIDGIIESAVLLGETFRPESLLTAFRTSGNLPALAEGGAVSIVAFAAAVDDAGKQAGTGLKRLKQVLSIPLGSAGAGGGVAVGTVERLIASGVRGEEGLSPAQADAAFEDPFKFIIDTIKPLLSEQALSGDSPALLENEIKALGFLGTDLRFIMSQIQNEDEILRKRAQADAFDLEQSYIEAQKNLSTQLDAITAQFKNVTNDALVPFFATLAPGAETLAGWLNQLANSESTLANFAKVGVTAAAPIAQFAAMNADMILLAGAGLKLNRSAAALDLAAASLQGAAGGGPLGPMGPKPTGPRMGFTPFQLGVTAINVVGLATMNVEATRVNFDEKVKPALENAVDAVAGEGTADKLNARNADLEKRAREGDVGWLMRVLRSMSGQDLPQPTRTDVAAAAARDQQQETVRRIEHLTGVMERNAEKAQDPERSAASAADLMRQNEKLAEQIATLKLEIAAAPIEPVELSFDNVPDLTADLSRSVFDGHEMGASIMTESLTSGGLTLGQVITSSLAEGAESLRRALTTPLSVGVAVEGPSPRSGLDTGNNTPF